MWKINKTYPKYCKIWKKSLQWYSHQIFFFSLKNGAFKRAKVFFCIILSALKRFTGSNTCPGIVIIIFKSSALWVDAFYILVVYISVCLSVCPSVCSLLRYRLNLFLIPLREFGCPIIFEILNPLGKVMKRNGLRFEHFSLEVVYNHKKTLYFWLLLPTKQDGNHASRWIRPLWSKGISLILAYY